MIKVSVLYPKKPDTHFDMKYYLNHHIPLAMRLLKNGLRRTEVDEGLHGTRPDELPAFHGGCQFYFDSVEAFAAVWGPAAAELVAGANQYLKHIPGLLHFHVGQMSPSPRPVVDQTYQVALNLIFPSKQAEQAYQIHPQHVEFVEKVFKRTCKKVLIYDFES